MAKPQISLLGKGFIISELLLPFRVSVNLNIIQVSDEQLNKLMSSKYVWLINHIIL